MRSTIRSLIRTGLTAGATLLAGTVLAGTISAGPTHADAPNLTFQPDIMCTSSMMVYGLDVTNNGADPVALRIVTAKAGSGSGTDRTLGSGETTTVSLDTTHYGISRILITVDGVTVYDTGEITSTGSGSGQCNLPLPAVRDDITFDVTATCGEIAANYTLTATSQGPEAMIDVKWVDDEGVPSYHTIPTNGSHTIVQEAGTIVSVTAADAWGRLLFISGDLVADGEGCPRSAIHLINQKVGLECSDGTPYLYIWMINSGDYVETVDVKWQAGLESDGIGETTPVTIGLGDTHDQQVVFPAGKSLLVTLTSSGSNKAFFVYELSDYETTCATEGSDTTVDTTPDTTDDTTPDTTVDTPTDSTLPETGNEAPVPTTTMAPRSLPITGRTSTSLVIVAAALLLSGLSVRLVGRRRV